MQTAATSVVSAAVIGGDLILGLGDGSIINCGRVQGPQGLKGDAGPMGATGRPGTDGNTIHTVAGAPDTTLGKDGDFAINTVVWEIYGPRAGGVWGTGTPLRGNKRGERESKDPIFGMGSGEDGSGGGRAYNTANLPLAGTGRAHTAPGGNIIPIGNNLVFQSNLNRWIIDSLTALDKALPVSVGDVLPDDGEYQGDLFLKDGILYVYAKEGWIAVGGEGGPPAYVGEDEPPGTPQTGELWYCTDEKYLTLFVYTGTTWAAAAPPVSLDGIESNVFELQENVQYIQKNMTPFEAHQELYGKHEVLEATQAEQDEKLNELGSSTSNNSDRLDEIDEKFEELDRTLAVGKWRFLSTSSSSNPQNGQFTLTAPDGTQPVRTWQQVAFAAISKVDSAGVTHEIQTWADGDRCEIYSTMDDGHAVFTIGDYAGLDTQLVFTELLESYGAPQDRLEYRIRHFAAGDGISFDEAEERYVNATGDTMTGPLKLKQKSTNHTVLNFNDEKDQNFFALKSEASPQNGQPGDTARINIAKGKQFKITSLEADKQLFKIYKNGNVFLGSLITPTEDTHAANKKYVDDAIAGISSGNTSYLPLSGGKLTGTLTTQSLTVQIRDGANQKGFVVQGGTSNSPRLWVDKDSSDLYVVGDVYVNSAGNSNAGSKYNGKRLATTNLVEAVEEHPGYRLRWKYKSSGDLQKGFFKISSNFIYLDKYDHDGKDFLVPMCTKDHGASDAGGMMCIYEMINSKYKPIQVWQIERSRFGYSYNSRSTLQLEAKGGHKPLEDYLSGNNIYYITFGGLF